MSFKMKIDMQVKLEFRLKRFPFNFKLIRWWYRSTFWLWTATDTIPLFHHFFTLSGGDWGNTSLMADLQVLKNNPARERLERNCWRRPYMARRAEHHSPFVYKSISNYFSHTIQGNFNYVFFRIVTLDPEIILRTLQPIEDGTLRPLTTGTH